MVAISGVALSVVHAGAKAISASFEHSMVLKADGTVWATGLNKYGELGDGTTTERLTFVKVMSSGQCGTKGMFTSRARACVCVCVCVCAFYEYVLV